MSSTTRKWEILRIIQENHHFTKRLVDSKSLYKIKPKTSSSSVDFNSTRSKFNLKQNLINKKIKKNNEEEINLKDENEKIKARSNQDFFKSKTVKHKRHVDNLMSDRKYDSEIEKMKNNFNPDVLQNSEHMFNHTAAAGMFKTKFNHIDTNMKKTLYQRKAFLQKLSLVNVEFSVEKKK